MDNEFFIHLSHISQFVLIKSNCAFVPFDTDMTYKNLPVYFHGYFSYVSINYQYKFNNLNNNKSTQIYNNIIQINNRFLHIRQLVFIRSFSFCFKCCICIRKCLVNRAIDEYSFSFTFFTLKYSTFNWIMIVDMVSKTVKWAAHKTSNK